MHYAGIYTATHLSAIRRQQRCIDASTFGLPGARLRSVHRKG
jgi:hypothetical protein